nr:hypothetical protein [Roseateles terrae]
MLEDWRVRPFGLGVLLHRLERGQGRLAEIHVPVLLRLRFLPLAPFERLHSLHPRDLVARVDVAPLECDEFLWPHAGEERELEIGVDPLVVVLGHVRQDGVALCQRQRVRQLLLGPGVLHLGERVVFSAFSGEVEGKHPAQRDQVVVPQLGRRPGVRADL